MFDTSYDPQYDIDRMFAPLPVYSQRKPPTVAGVKSLLEQVTSARYNAEQSRDELPHNEHFNAAYNAGWIEMVGYRWSGGTKYRQHRITANGRAALQVLKRQFALVPVQPSVIITYGYDSKRDPLRTWCLDQLYAEHAAMIRDISAMGVPF